MTLVEQINSRTPEQQAQRIEEQEREKLRLELDWFLFEAGIPGRVWWEDKFNNERALWVSYLIKKPSGDITHGEGSRLGCTREEAYEKLPETIEVYKRHVAFAAAYKEEYDKRKQNNPDFDTMGLEDHFALTADITEKLYGKKARKRLQSIW